MRALAIVHQRDAGAGVFADAIRARGGELDYWFCAESASPPSDPAAYDAVLTFGGAMHADQDDRHPWLARGESAPERPARGRHAAARRSASAPSCSRRPPPLRPRRAIRPEIGWSRGRGDRRRDDAIRCSGPSAPRFEAFQWHSYEFPLPPGATPLARSDVCLQAYRVGERAWGIQFHAEVSHADAQAWIDDYESDEDAVRIGFDPERLRRRTDEAIGAWNALGRDLCGRFLEAAATRA